MTAAGWRPNKLFTYSILEHSRCVGVGAGNVLKMYRSYLGSSRGHARASGGGDGNGDGNSRNRATRTDSGWRRRQRGTAGSGTAMGTGHVNGKKLFGTLVVPIG